jgi:nucleoside-diphosphate-sugar epimerase
MDVLIAGGHGQIARRLIRILAADGHTARGLIRNPAHVADIEADGGHPVLCDLEHDDLRPHVGGADAIVFAAGAGPGSGPERKQTVDLGAAVKLIDAAKAQGVPRYLMVGSIGAHDPSSGPESMRPYLEAKAKADAALQQSGLDFTIVRPGGLTDDAGTGKVALSTHFGERDQITRDDVAQILATALTVPETIGLTFEAFNGDQEIELALRALSREES